MFVSSVQITFFQSSSVQCSYFKANARRASFIAALSPGFLVVLTHLKPCCLRTLPTVRLEISPSSCLATSLQVECRPFVSLVTISTTF
jgi:hypothetical protein